MHGVGAELEVQGAPGRLRLREIQQHLGRPWEDVAADLSSAARIQSEPHALVIRREVSEWIGGLDESLLSWFDHTDLALHHRRLGLEAWFVPEATCPYLTPPLALHDLPGFLLRWSDDWYVRSLDRLCEVWGLDRDDREWDHHARYRTGMRRQRVGTIAVQGCRYRPRNGAHGADTELAVQTCSRIDALSAPVLQYLFRTTPQREPRRAAPRTKTRRQSTVGDVQRLRDRPRGPLSLCSSSDTVSSCGKTLASGARRTTLPSGLGGLDAMPSDRSRTSGTLDG